MLHLKNSAGSPRVKLMVGKNYVIHLITDDIYIDLKMLSWRSGGNGGGFVTKDLQTKTYQLIQIMLRQF